MTAQIIHSMGTGQKQTNKQKNSREMINLGICFLIIPHERWAHWPLIFYERLYNGKFDTNENQAFQFSESHSV